MLHWQEFARAVASRQSARRPLARYVCSYLQCALGLSHARDTNQPTPPALRARPSAEKLPFAERYNSP